MQVADIRNSAYYQGAVQSINTHVSCLHFLRVVYNICFVYNISVLLTVFPCFLHDKSANQSINQSINQSNNQSIKQANKFKKAWVRI